MVVDSPSPEFYELAVQYFDPLCRALGLASRTPEAGNGFGWVSAEAGTVRAFFEHDRGLCSFAIGAAGAQKPLCAVETIAKRFPRLRLLAEGADPGAVAVAKLLEGLAAV